MGDLDWVDEVAVETFNEKTLAGLAVGVVRGGELAHFVGLGQADADAGRAIGPDTVFRIGSISKTFTAIAVLQLVEAGTVGLDDPVDEHLRSFRIQGPAGAEPVTIRHLLTHTAGIGELRRWTDLVRPTIGLGAKLGAPLPSLSEYYEGGLRAEIAPGRKWAYANHGFAALGQLVEDMSGRPFAEHMRKAVFEPLGMERTDFLRSGRVTGELAVGYVLKRGRLTPVKDREIVIAPAGSVFSSTADMARYVTALTSGGAPVLRRETLELMLTPQGDDRLDHPAMGLAFMLERPDGHRIAGHDGGWPGFVSSMLVAPDDGVGVLAFTNTSVSFAPHDVTERVLRRLLDVPEPAETTGVPASPHLWPKLTGVYKPAPGLNTNFRLWPVTGGEVEVVVKRGHLTVTAPSPVPRLRKGIRLHAADPDDPWVFQARIDDVVVPVVFERADDGRAEAVRTGSARGGFVRLHRRPRATSLRLWGRAAGGAAAAAGVAATVRWRRRR